ncbi:MAG: RHS repeat protein [Nitrospinae bacterium]|nr:RHS repeat protein [Nitrospinota bacterium]
MKILLKKTYPDITTESFTYDPVGNRLTGPKEKLNYTYNEGNQLKDMVKQDSSPHRGEGWDEGESSIPIPLFFKEGSGKISYTYDKNGNLTKKLEYDDDGNIKKTTLYTYDYENRLTKVEMQNRAPISPLLEPVLSEAEGKEVNGGGLKVKIITFTYDPFGRRLSKSISHLSLRDQGKLLVYL